MGKAWDGSKVAFDIEVWREVLRVLKPGAHLLAFGGTRTYHRMVCAIEDAGFEIRDSIHWVYGSGFPKSLDVSKAIDSAAGAVREVVGKSSRHGGGTMQGASFQVDCAIPDLTAPATHEAEQWDGWGTALKPAHEPIVIARKPLAGTVAANVLAHGTGGINVDACRIEYASKDDQAAAAAAAAAQRACQQQNGTQPFSGGYSDGPGSIPGFLDKQSLGRWPPNLLLTHSEDCGSTCVDGCPVAEMDRQSGERPGMSGGGKHRPDYQGGMFGAIDSDAARGDSGGASRFFPVFRYEAKAGRSEREWGCEAIAPERKNDGRKTDREVPNLRNTKAVHNFHPTVKPVALMRWLARLVTPPGGRVLDLYAGSGTTGCACVAEGFDFTGIELKPEHVAICEARIRFWERFPGGGIAAKESIEAEIRGQLPMFGGK
jgi:site-specific DNA-methyltransferase (adenine-specific)